MLTSDRAPERRITHTIGDFIEYKDRDNNDIAAIARLDYLFVHEYFKEYRLFAIVTDSRLSSRRDPVLGLPFMNIADGGFAGHRNKFGTRIVGLPVITASRPYVVSVIENDGGMDLDQNVIYSKDYSSDLDEDRSLIYCNAWEAISL